MQRLALLLAGVALAAVASAGDPQFGVLVVVASAVLAVVLSNLVLRRFTSEQISAVFGAPVPHRARSATPLSHSLPSLVLLSQPRR